MAKAPKLSHEELQKDEVAEGMQKALDWVQVHRVLLIGLGILVLIALFAGMAWSSHQAKVLRVSNDLITEALSDYAQLANTNDPGERQKVVDRILTSIKNLRDQYPSIPLAHEALYLKGSVYYSTDKFPEAQEAYKAYIDGAADDQQRAMGEIGLGYAYENESFWLKDKTAQLNKLTPSLAQYTQAAVHATPKSYLYYYALLGQARINELTGKNDEAIRLYKQIVADRPSPIPVTEEKTKKGEEKDQLMAMLVKQINEQESKLSFQATAELRLKRLEEKAGLKAAPVAQIGAAELPGAASTPAATAGAPAGTAATTATAAMLQAAPTAPSPAAAAPATKPVGASAPTTAPAAR
ncbi:MAG: tetratricopeptide repeat protein [bacterium]|nr:tetratricopeptide repeat protein [bacterium]